MNFMFDNSNVYYKSLLERGIPIKEISRDAAIEMSFKPTPAYYARCKELELPFKNTNFYDPKIRSLHPWLARRPRSVARALNLAALLPPDTDTDKFLLYLGFSRQNLVDTVLKGYPPLISYLKPNLSTAPQLKDTVIVDPMAGGGTIPLEAAILGVNTIACEYNPVAYLLLRGTIEFPAKYGLELWKQLVKEVKNLSDYVIREVSPYYGSRVEGYIVLRQVEVNGNVIPLQSSIPISKKACLIVEKDGSLNLTKSKERIFVRRELLKTWMKQHVMCMKGKIELFKINHRIVAVQTEKELKIADESDCKLLEKAYANYLSKVDAISLPKISIPKDNEVFSEILPLDSYHMLFNPRQALALHIMISYIKGRIQELVEKEGEFGAAIGLYLAFGIDRIVDFNSIITTWNHNTLTIRDSIGSYYKYRKFRLEGNYAEAIVPYRTINWVYEAENNEKTAGGICPIVKELAEKLEGKKCNIHTFMCDATKLSQHFRNLADVINVDPPYYDQHLYSDFSEFFWPFLKVALEPALNILFKDRILFDWTPNNWRVPKSNEIVARKKSGNIFEKRLERALKEMRMTLKDDGLLIFWFSHRSIDAWKAVIKALSEAQLSITAIIPFPSEHPTRSITHGGLKGINRVLIIVARKKEYIKERNPEEILNKFENYLLEAKIHPRESIPKEELEILKMAASYAISKC